MIGFGLSPLRSAQQNFITVKGSVFESGTENPISDVQVIIHGMANGQTTTDGSGHFSISAVPSGLHPIQVQRNGYLQPDNLPAIDIDLKDDRPIKLFLIRGAAISGRIVDPKGTPVSQALITISRTAYFEGERVLSEVPASQRNILTDDRGQYRAFWFPPGEYYISAEYRPIRSGQQPINTDGFAPTYYPGTSNWSEARPFVVRAGEELSSIDFVMQVQTKPSKRVIGVIGVPPELGANVVASGLYLVPRGIPTSVSNPPLLAVGSSMPDFPSNFRRFTISDVPCGSYNLIARATGGNTYYSATIPIEVGPQDAGFPQYFVEAGTNLKIRLTVPGALTTPASLDSLAIRLLPVEFGISPTVTPPPTIKRGPDGSFTFANLPKASYRIVVTGLPPDAYVADIREGGDSIFSGGVIAITKSGSAMDVEMILGLHGGTMRGAVVGVDDAAASKVTVVLVPASSQRRNAQLYRRIALPDSGQFEFRGVAPGSYTLFALTNVPPGAEQSVEYMKNHEDFGLPVQVRDEIMLNGLQVSLSQNRH
jgi:hypothetical protein